METTILNASNHHFQKYLSWLERQPLSSQTRRAYRSRTNHFLSFLSASGEDVGVLVQTERERAHVLREYKQYLKLELRSSPATVNAYLTAIDHFFEFLGSKSACGKVPREELPQEAPRALTKEEQMRFLRAVAACRRSKDRAVAILLLYTGIRISECAALKEHDVSIAGRKNQVIVRNGKGGRYREIPLNREVKDALGVWIAERNNKFTGKRTDEPLFLNPQGKGLSTSSLDLIIRKIGQSCGLAVSAHVLRHTCLTNLVRNGKDLVLVAEIGGHKRLETTRRYTLPTISDKERAVQELLE